MSGFLNHSADKKNRIRYGVVFVGLVLLFCIAVVLNINTGSVHISVREILDIILHRAADTPQNVIIWKIRLPRLLTAAVLGGALSLSGFLLQTFFRNPIAGPYVLGISAGAKMLLALVTIFCAGRAVNLTGFASVATAFVGAMLSMLLVLAFAGVVQNMATLLVIGIMISNIFSAITDFCINFANEADIVNLTHWSLGSFSGASWANLRMSSVIVLPAFLLTIFISKPMGAYMLGEGYAKSLGIHVVWFRFVLITLSSVLSACVTAFAGPIAFVGIAVPHIAKLLMRTAKPIVMIPAVFLTGSVFCMLCDLVSRMLLSPAELSLGTVTGIIGAPVVIWLMLGQRRKSEKS